MSKFSRKFWDFISRENSLDEIDAMSDQAVADLGLDRSGLRSLVQARPDVRMQMVRMAEEFGLAEADITRPRWRALECVHTCQTCPQPKACYRYLTGTGDGAFGPQDCPNAETYAEIAANPSGRPADSV